MFIFEISATLAGPLSVAQRGEHVAIILRKGTVIDATIVQMINDLMAVGYDPDGLLRRLRGEDEE